MTSKSIRCRLLLLVLCLCLIIPFVKLNAAIADEEEEVGVTAENTDASEVEEKACIAQLHFESEDGKYSNISENAEVVKDAPGTCYVKVDGGTFTVKLKVEDLIPELKANADENSDAEATADAENTLIPEKISGVKVLCVDISGIKQLLNDYNLKLDVSDVVVACDGNVVELDSHKLVLGSAEENDNLRIEIFNVNGATAGENAPIDDKNFEFSKNLSVTFTVNPASKGQDAYIVFANGKGRYFSSAEKPKSEPLTVDGDGTYSLSLAAIDSEGDKVKVSGITNFYVEIPGLINQISDWSELRVTDVSITCDGEPVELDTAEIYWGNTKNDGNFRIDFYDETKSGADYTGAVDKKKFEFRDTMVVNFTIEGLKVGFPEEVVKQFVYVEPTPEVEETDADIDGTEGTENGETEEIEPTAEPVVTEAPVETPTPVPTASPTPVPIRGLNDNIREKENDGIGALGKVGIALGIIIVLGGGVAVVIFGKEK